MLRADICFPPRAPSASATWQNRRKSIRRTRTESSRTCRSVDPSAAIPQLDGVSPCQCGGRNADRKTRSGGLQTTQPTIGRDAALRRYLFVVEETVTNV